MRLAVGTYSGPRAVCGAVAQLANNATHVTTAIGRKDTFAFSSLIGIGRFLDGRDVSEEVFSAHEFSVYTLGLYRIHAMLRAVIRVETKSPAGRQ